MGLSAAGAVAAAVLVAVTLIPALLGFFPRAVLPRAARPRPPRTACRRLWPARAAADGTPDPDGVPNLGSRWASFVLRRPVTVLVPAMAALGVIALPVTHLHLGNAGNATLPTSSTQRQAYDDISKAFGPGYNGPLTIVVTTSGARDPQSAAAEVASGCARS
jgi:RND superfamily putative drug exporter